MCRERYRKAAGCFPKTNRCQHKQVHGNRIFVANEEQRGKNNPQQIDAIALWDSYPPDSADLSDNPISVISIFGTTNNLPNTENFNDKKHLLPTDTIFIGLEGANHAQFGDYGPQKGDVPASISLAEQHEQVVEMMLDFINP